MIKENYIPTKDPNVASKIVEGQAIVIGVRFKKRYDNLLIFNETGTEIWELIGKKRNVKRITEILLKKFNISEDIAKREVSAFLKNLAVKKIIYFKK